MLRMIVQFRNSGGTALRREFDAQKEHSDFNNTEADRLRVFFLRLSAVCSCAGRRGGPEVDVSCFQWMILAKLLGIGAGIAIELLRTKREGD